MKLFGGGNSRKGASEKTRSTISEWLEIPENRKKAIWISSGAVALILLIAVAVWFLRPPTVDLSMGDSSQPNLLNDESLGAHVDGKYTFLICATDIDGTRTDSMMVASFDTKEKTVNVVNVPRDTMSNVDRVGSSKKINAAYGTKQGIVATKNEVRMLLGFTPDKYIVMSFNAIAQVVDAIGGVDYEIPFRMKYDDPVQSLHIDFQPGTRHLDGQQVVEFLRWRKNNKSVGQPTGTYGSDEGRISKQQDFLKYLAGQVLTVKNTANIPKIVTAITSNVKTDLSAREMLWFAREAIGIGTEKINMMTLPGFSDYAYGGSRLQHSYFFPNADEVLEMVNTYFNPFDQPITSVDIVSGPDKTRPGGSSSTSSGNKNNTTTDVAPDEDIADPEEDLPDIDDSESTQPETPSNPDTPVTPEQPTPEQPTPEQPTEPTTETQPSQTQPSQPTANPADPEG